ncbi:MAG: hypothetical protein WC554_18040, partial [Clostridia bacterium]
NIDTSLKPSIDAYWILIGTLSSGAGKLFVNSVLANSASGAGAISAGAAQVYLMSSNTPSYYDVSKAIIAGLVNGALTDAEVLMLSRRIDQRYNLRIGV